MSKSDWQVRDVSASEGSEPLFFTSHEWATVDAATARIIPTDQDPGAREAEVVRFLDRFLSGTDFVYASADGAGFLVMTGKDQEAWTARIRSRQATYRDGLVELDELSKRLAGALFVDCSPEQQDAVLVELSGAPKPMPVTNDQGSLGQGGPPPTNQPVSDEGMGFFDMLVLHTRQGFYADPVYGGNRDHIGWKVIGFPGPSSLAETTTGRFTTTPYLLMEARWPFADDPSVRAFTPSEGDVAAVEPTSP